MVTKYTDEIIDMFVAEYTPEQVCAQLGLCKISLQFDEYVNAIRHQLELELESLSPYPPEHSG
jgi:hypothetical protein